MTKSAKSYDFADFFFYLILNTFFKILLTNPGKLSTTTFIKTLLLTLL